MLNAPVPDLLIGDAPLVLTAVVLVSTYTLTVLGGCSPIHFRAMATLIGTLCIGLSITSGYGIAFATGNPISRAHGILPFMVLGIGVDDLYVIVNSIDQTPLHLDPNERFRKGLMHAGPSITITSLTDGLAFFLGSFTSLPALRSFCIFSGLCVITLYFSFLTIFSSWFIRDLRRMHEKRGDCCGICCCKLDSIFCCSGALLSQ